MKDRFAGGNQRSRMNRYGSETIGGDLTAAALCLALAGAFSWAVGNVLVKRTADVPVFPLVVWASLVPPLPALLLSAIYDGHVPIEGLDTATSPREIHARLGYLPDF